MAAGRRRGHHDEEQAVHGRGEDPPRLGDSLGAGRGEEAREPGEEQLEGVGVQGAEDLPECPRHLIVAPGGQSRPARDEHAIE